MVRTVFDVSQRLPVTEATAVADMALHANLVQLTSLQERADQLAGRKGVKRFRRVVDLAEPKAESPMETRLRLVLVLGGLPRPQVQANLEDEHGDFVGRADLYYPQKRLVIEYDGTTHRDSVVEDDRRQNRLVGAGYIVLRFAASDMAWPKAIVIRVRSLLRAK
jgi:very-short-patch-repair endonuclease